VTRDDVKKILARCASFDQRTVGQADVTAWLLVLDDLTYAECDRAVVDYYREHRERIMPSDIVHLVLDARSAWLRANGNVGPQHPEIVAPWTVSKAIER
jgi:hypothetical protein